MLKQQDKGMLAKAGALATWSVAFVRGSAWELSGSLIPSPIAQHLVRIRPLCHVTRSLPTDGNTHPFYVWKHFRQFSAYVHLLNTHREIE